MPVPIINANSAIICIRLAWTAHTGSLCHKQKSKMNNTNTWHAADYLPLQYLFRKYGPILTDVLSFLNCVRRVIQNYIKYKWLRAISFINGNVGNTQEIRNIAWETIKCTLQWLYHNMSFKRVLLNCGARVTPQQCLLGKLFSHGWLRRFLDNQLFWSMKICIRMV